MNATPSLAVRKVRDLLLQYTDPKPEFDGIMAMDIAKVIVQAMRESAEVDGGAVDGGVCDE